MDWNNYGGSNDVSNDERRKRFRCKVVSSYHKKFKDKLTTLREQIDKLDDDVMHTLAARMKISEQIGTYKRDNNVTILQVSRWEEIIQTRLAQGNAMGLSEDFVNNMLKLIHQESISVQQRVMNDKRERV